MPPPVAIGAETEACGIGHADGLSVLSHSVAGAGTGLGRAILLRLCAPGATAAGFGRRTDRLEEIAKSADVVVMRRRAPAAQAAIERPHRQVLETPFAAQVGSAAQTPRSLARTNACGRAAAVFFDACRRAAKKKEG